MNHVDIIREAFGYISLFKDKVFVIKIDDALIEDQHFPLLIGDIVLLHKMGIRIIIVPEARKRIDEILTAYNIPCDFNGGIRVTTPESISYVKMAAFDVSNKIMTHLAENNVHAVMGNWVRARGKGVVNGTDYQHTGTVDKLEIDIITNAVNSGLILLFPNIGWSQTGIPYNISSNELASRISTDLQASKLFFVTDCSGISTAHFSLPPEEFYTNEGVLSEMTVEQCSVFLEKNYSPASPHTHLFEMLALAVEACRGGVQRAHIVQGKTQGALLTEIFSNRGSGTMIYANQFENIRPMRAADIPVVLQLLSPFMDSGQIKPRTSDDLHLGCDDFVVYDVDGMIHGCAALHRLEDSVGEIAAFAVDSDFGKRGIGEKVLSYLFARAREKKFTRLILLTVQASDWFSRFGFTQGTVSDLPQSKKERYDTVRKPRVLVAQL